MEVMEARLIRAAELNGEMDDDDDAGGTRLLLAVSRGGPFLPCFHLPTFLRSLDSGS